MVSHAVLRHVRGGRGVRCSRPAVGWGAVVLSGRQPVIRPSRAAWSWRCRRRTTGCAASSCGVELEMQAKDDWVCCLLVRRGLRVLRRSCGNCSARRAPPRKAHGCSHAYHLLGIDMHSTAQYSTAQHIVCATVRRVPCWRSSSRLLLSSSSSTSSLPAASTPRCTSSVYERRSPVPGDGRAAVSRCTRCTASLLAHVADAVLPPQHLPF